MTKKTKHYFLISLNWSFILIVFIALTFSVRMINLLLLALAMLAILFLYFFLGAKFISWLGK